MAGELGVTAMVVSSDQGLLRQTALHALSEFRNLQATRKGARE